MLRLVKQGDGDQTVPVSHFTEHIAEEFANPDTRFAVFIRVTNKDEIEMSLSDDKISNLELAGIISYAQLAIMTAQADEESS